MRVCVPCEGRVVVVKVTCTMPGRVTLRGLSVPLGIYLVQNALLIYEMIRVSRFLAIALKLEARGRHESPSYPVAECMPVPSLIQQE